MTGIRQVFLVLSCLFTMNICKVVLPWTWQKPVEAAFEHSLEIRYVKCLGLWPSFRTTRTKAFHSFTIGFCLSLDLCHEDLCPCKHRSAAFGSRLPADTHQFCWGSLSLLLAINYCFHQVPSSIMEWKLKEQYLTKAVVNDSCWYLLMALYRFTIIES